MRERTGSPVLLNLWSYVKALCLYIYMGMSKVCGNRASRKSYVPATTSGQYLVADECQTTSTLDSIATSHSHTYYSSVPTPLNCFSSTSSPTSPSQIPLT